MTPDQFQIELETLLDKAGLRQTLEALSAICSEKADHIRSNWQDEQLAKLWDKAAKRIGNLNVDV